VDKYSEKSLDAVMTLKNQEITTQHQKRNQFGWEESLICF